MRRFVFRLAGAGPSLLLLLLLLLLIALYNCPFLPFLELNIVEAARIPRPYPSKRSSEGGRERGRAQFRPPPPSRPRSPPPCYPSPPLRSFRRRWSKYRAKSVGVRREYASGDADGSGGETAMKALGRGSQREETGECRCNITRN